MLSQIVDHYYVVGVIYWPIVIIEVIKGGV